MSALPEEKVGSHLALVSMAVIKNKKHNKTEKQKAASAVKETGKMETWFAVGGNAPWFSCCGKQYGSFHTKLKIELPREAAISSGYLSKRCVGVAPKGLVFKPNIN